MADPRDDDELRRTVWARKALAATNQTPPETGWHWREAVRAEEELARREEARRPRRRP